MSCFLDACCRMLFFGPSFDAVGRCVLVFLFEPEALIRDIDHQADNKLTMVTINKCDLRGTTKTPIYVACRYIILEAKTPREILQKCRLKQHRQT